MPLSTLSSSSLPTLFFFIFLSFHNFITVAEKVHLSPLFPSLSMLKLMHRNRMGKLGAANSSLKWPAFESQ